MHKTDQLLALTCMSSSPASTLSAFCLYSLISVAFDLKSGFKDQTQGTVSFLYWSRWGQMQGVEGGSKGGMVDTHLDRRSSSPDLAHLERLPPHHHHPLPHCRPARPACRPHTHPRFRRPHCSPLA